MASGNPRDTVLGGGSHAIDHCYYRHIGSVCLTEHPEGAKVPLHGGVYCKHEAVGSYTRTGVAGRQCVSREHTLWFICIYELQS
jgi:hypothetical protein